MIKDAIISECGRYRYQLTRTWGDDSPAQTVNFVMLNPSTADDKLDDPTIRRCINFAKQWRYGSLIVTNLFALRAVHPQALQKSDNPVGKFNFNYLISANKKSDLTVCAWGNHGQYLNQCVIVRKILAMPHYLKLTKGGQPSHPLYLPKGLVPIYWGGLRA